MSEPVDPDQLWKQFGRDTPAGKALYAAYMKRKPTEARMHASMSSNVGKNAAPKPAWGAGKGKGKGKGKKVVVPKFSGMSRARESRDEDDFYRGPVRTSIKTKQQIVLETNNYAEEQFTGGGVAMTKDGKRPLRGGPKEKEKFVNKMSQPHASASAGPIGLVGGGVKPQSTSAMAAARRQAKGNMAAAAAADEDPEHALFKQIVSEIEERKQFLDEMAAVGKAAQYEKEIAAEISQRVARLKQLDRQMAQNEGF